LNKKYNTPYEVRSGRNFIPMCGRHGRGGCHDLFDSHKFCLLPTLDDNVFSVFKLHPDADQLVDTVVLPYGPYRRGLAARAILAFAKFQSDNKRVSPDTVFQLDFSDTSSNRKMDTLSEAALEKRKARREKRKARHAGETKVDVPARTNVTAKKSATETQSQPVKGSNSTNVESIDSDGNQAPTGEATRTDPSLTPASNQPVVNKKCRYGADCPNLAKCAFQHP